MTVLGPHGEELELDDRILVRFIYKGELDDEGNLKVNLDDADLGSMSGDGMGVTLRSWSEATRSGYKRCPVWVTVTVDATYFKG
jgi:hypothetical protein